MSQYIFSMHKLGKVVPPKRHILKDISLSFFPGAKIGILGLNGSGKSTLLKIMAGLDKDFLGEAVPQKDIKIGYLPQEPQLDPSKDVRGNVEKALEQVINLKKRFDTIIKKYSEPMSEKEMEQLVLEQDALQTKIEALNGWNIDLTLNRAAQALKLPPWNQNITQLSGGEKRRVALCQLILSEPDMLLLDEPTNHLDAESVAWLEVYLKNFKGTVVAITHDRYFLDNVAGWMLGLDRGQGIPFEGNYSAWLEQKSRRLAHEQKQESALQKMLKHELEWVRTNPKGRRAKNKARLARFEEINSKEFQKRNETSELYIPPGQRLGDQVIEVVNLSKHFAHKVLFHDLNFIIPKGSIVGIIGANGAGKSTFFKIISGQEQADAGEIKLGQSTEIAYVDQSRDSLDGTKTVWEEVSQGHDLIIVGQFEMPSRAYLGRFNFKGHDQQKHVADLSGGERNRLHLAKLLKKGGNVLLLDEPTNDLDVETLRALEVALLNFPGCALVISHDRWFLDRISTHILAFEKDQVNWFDGNYSEYEQYQKQKTETT